MTADAGILLCAADFLESLQQLLLLQIYIQSGLGLGSSVIEVSLPAELSLAVAAAVMSVRTCSHICVAVMRVTKSWHLKGMGGGGGAELEGARLGPPLERAGAREKVAEALLALLPVIPQSDAATLRIFLQVRSPLPPCAPLKALCPRRALQPPLPHVVHRCNGTQTPLPHVVHRCDGARTPLASGIASCSAG